MAKYQIRYNPDQRVLIITFSGHITYKTLLTSLKEFDDFNIRNVKKILLDFTDAVAFTIKHTQWHGYKAALNLMTSNNRNVETAIIGPQKTCWEKGFTFEKQRDGQTPIQTIRYFSKNTKSDAYSWTGTIKQISGPPDKFLIGVSN